MDAQKAAEMIAYDLRLKKDPLEILTFLTQHALTINYPLDSVLLVANEQYTIGQLIRETVAHHSFFAKPAPKCDCQALLTGLAELTGTEGKNGFQIIIRYNNCQDGGIVLDADDNVIGECFDLEMEPNQQIIQAIINAIENSQRSSDEQAS